MKYANAIIDSYNAAVGAIVAVLSYILGEHWILFVAFLLLNVADWLTGWMKSRMAGKENSVRGWKVSEKARILAHDYGGFRGERCIYRNRSSNRN